MMMLFPRGGSGVAGQEGVSNGRCCGGEDSSALQRPRCRASGGQRNGAITGRRESGLVEVPLGAGTLRIRIVRSGAGRLERREEHGPGLSGDRDQPTRQGVHARRIILARSRGDARDISWRSSKGYITGGAQQSDDRAWSVPPASPAKFRVGLTIPLWVGAGHGQRRWVGARGSLQA